MITIMNRKIIGNNLTFVSCKICIVNTPIILTAELIKAITAEPLDEFDVNPKVSTDVLL